MTLRTDIASADAQSDHAAQHNEVNTAVLALQAAGGKILAYTAYKPGTAFSASRTSTSFADLDATNLSITYTVPSSGKTLVELTIYAVVGSGNYIVWNLRDGSGNVSGTESLIALAGEGYMTYPIVLTGQTPGASQTYKWGWRSYNGGNVQVVCGDEWGTAMIKATALP